MTADPAQSASSDGLQANAPELWGALRSFRPREEIATRSSAGANIFLVQSGWVARLRPYGSGCRAILEIILPGEHSPLESNRAATIDSYVAFCPSELQFASTQKALAEMASSSAFARYISACELRRRAILEERAVSLGQRSALQRVAHFICELNMRLQGCFEAKPCMFPLTQTDIGEFLGLSTVHTNRVLQKLRRDGLIDLARQSLQVINFTALASLSDFSNAYLD